MARALWIALLLAGCVSAGGISLWTNPVSYLKKFPLNEVDESGLVARVGPPDDVIERGNETWMVYEYGEEYGRRKYTFTLTDGLVSDVQYSDQGPYNGITARRLQAQ